MLRHALMTTAIAFVGISPALAAPGDYAERLPLAIHDMELQEWDDADGEIVAYYGESIGRATLWIVPAPDADPDGHHESEAQLSGETPASQLALADWTSRNLRNGTAALGDGYTLSAVRNVSIRLDGHESIDDVPISCAVIERQQAEDAVEDGKERLDLVDRICTIQNGEDVLITSITTPHNETHQDQVQQQQLMFAGLLLGSLVREEE